MRDRRRFGQPLHGDTPRRAGMADPARTPPPTRIQIQYGLASEQGRRPRNEDYAGIWLGTPGQQATQGIVAAVADGVGGSKGGLGYLGLSYVEQNAGKLKAVEIDGGDGCVAPSLETVQDGSYKPLSRPLLIYARVDALEDKVQVSEFLQFLLTRQAAIARKALFVPLTAEQKGKALTILEGAGIDAGSE